MFRKVVDQDVSLVFLQPSFAETLFGLIDSDRWHLNQWLGWPPKVKTVQDTQAFIRQSIIDYAENRAMVCAIEYLGQIVGVVSYNKIHTNLRKVELGYWLGSGWQGRGIITRACQSLIDYALHDLGMEKVQIAVAEGNTSSRKVCERLGAVQEGIITRSEYLHGNVVDHVIYGIYKSSRH